MVTLSSAKVFGRSFAKRCVPTLVYFIYSSYELRLVSPSPFLDGFCCELVADFSTRWKTSLKPSRAIQ
jgi:hypothetical protein